MDGGSVVLAAQLAGDLRKAELKLVTQHVHGDLPRYDDVLVAFRADDILNRYLEMPGSAFNDLLGAQMLGTGPVDVEQAGGDAQRRLNIAHLAPGQQLVKGALQLADIGRDIRSQVLH